MRDTSRPAFARRSPGYPAPDTRNDHLYRTRIKEEVEVRVTRAEAPTLLDETQQGKTFARRVRYSLSPAPDGTLLRVEDNVRVGGRRCDGRVAGSCHAAAQHGHDRGNGARRPFGGGFRRGWAVDPAADGTAPSRDPLNLRA